MHDIGLLPRRPARRPHRRGRPADVRRRGRLPAQQRTEHRRPDRHVGLHRLVLRLGPLPLDLLPRPIDAIGERRQFGRIAIADPVDLRVAPFPHLLRDPHPEVGLALIRPRHGIDLVGCPEHQSRRAAEVTFERGGQRRIALRAGQRRRQ